MRTRVRMAMQPHAPASKTASVRIYMYIHVHLYTSMSVLCMRACHRVEGGGQGRPTSCDIVALRAAARDGGRGGCTQQ